MKENTVILPKGTIVKLNGFPCELTIDAEVRGFTESDLEWFSQIKNQSEPRETQPALHKNKIL